MGKAKEELRHRAWKLSAVTSLLEQEQLLTRCEVHDIVHGDRYGPADEELLEIAKKMGGDRAKSLLLLKSAVANAGVECGGCAKNAER
jgi:hypothetical protein